MSRGEIKNSRDPSVAKKSREDKYQEKFIKKRRFGLQPMGKKITDAAQPALRRHGFALADLIVKWPHIIGDRLAAICQPKRLIFPKGEKMNGVLYCQAQGAWALELQHQAPLVIQRINTFFGYNAVSRIQISQGYFKSIWQAPAKKEYPGAEEILKLTGADTLQKLEKIENEALKQAMTSLAGALAYRRHKKTVK